MKALPGPLPLAGDWTGDERDTVGSFDGRAFLLDVSGREPVGNVPDVYHELLFLGTPTAFLALLGAVRARHRYAIFATLLATGALLVALGAPLLWLPYELLPGFDNFKPLARVLFLFAFGVSILAAFGLDWVLRRPLLAGDRPGRWPFVGRAALIVALLGVLVWQMNEVGSRVMRHQPADTAMLYPETELISWLRQQSEQSVLPLYPMLDASTPMIFGVRSVGGYDSLVPRRTVDVWRVVEGSSVDEVLEQPLVWAYHARYYPESIRAELLPRLGVGLVAVPADVLSTGEWRRVLGLVALEERYSSDEGAVYAVTEALPRLQLLDRCEVVPDRAGALARFTDPGFDASRVLLLEEDELGESADCVRAPSRSDPGRAEVVETDLSGLRVEVDTDDGAWLLVREAWGPGWRATIDGRAADVVPGDVLFRAVRVPPGRHVVELRYEPPGFRSGVALAIAAIAALLAAAALTFTRFVRGRRAGARL
ncbi:MAG: YfhO family protein [Acidimicrobiia bacterium]|nr:YfhO family protein [Acidimicrobiia bacterium]